MFECFLILHRYVYFIIMPRRRSIQPPLPAALSRRDAIAYVPVLTCQSVRRKNSSACLPSRVPLPRHPPVPRHAKRRNTRRGSAESVARTRRQVAASRRSLRLLASLPPCAGFVERHTPMPAKPSSPRRAEPGEAEVVSGAQKECGRKICE